MPGASTGWELVADNTGGTIGGLATALAAGRTLVFAATPVGIYRSSDAGLTWQLPADRDTVPFAEMVAPSPGFERDQTLFACARDALYRSSDGGETWQPVLVGSRMLSLAYAVDDARASAGRLLLAGTETDGVLRSDDDGRTWTGANAGLLDLTALTLAVSPHFASDHVGFVGMASGLYRTRNGARSWREVETGLAEPGVQCVAISPRFAEDRLVLAGTEGDGLLRSDDAGTTWYRPESLKDNAVTAVAFSTRYASKPTIAAATDAGIALSEDGGQTWRQASGSPAGMVLSLTFAATANDANGEVLLAGLHRDGVARSSDDGQSWAVSNTGLRAGLLTGLALSPSFSQDQTMFLSGPQDGVRVSTDGGHTWAERTAGLGEDAVLSLAVSPDYATDGTLYVATSAGVKVSHDGATTWTAPPAVASPASLVATSPARVAGARATVMAVLADGGLMGSEDGGQTWRATASGFNFGGADITALALAPDDPPDGTLFVATRQTGSATPGELVVWRSVDGGERWDRHLVEREAGDDVSRGQPFVALAVSPSYRSDGLVLVAPAARVLKPLRHAREVRGGQSRPIWRATELGMGAAAVTSIAISPDAGHDRTLYAATNAGVFVSYDAGDTFQPWSEGLAPLGVVSLAISPGYRSDRLIYALGLGGTLWRRRG